MKLTREQIQFIDQYLLKSEVFFVDTRMELTDHIASAVEEKMQSENLDFYDAFKDYMIVNKKELLKQNKTSWQDLEKTAQTFFKAFLHPVIVLILPLSYLISDYIHRDEGINTGNMLIKTNFMLLIIFVPLTISAYILKKRFSVVERLTTIMTLTYYIVLSLLFSLDLSGISKSTTFIILKTLEVAYIASMLVFVRLYIILWRKYNKSYS